MSMTHASKRSDTPNNSSTFAFESIISSSHRSPDRQAHESDRITGLLACHVLPYERSIRRSTGFLKPAEPSGLLYEASVALQGLLVQLTDLSCMRERDPLVLQHKRPHPALGQACLVASGATESHRLGCQPQPFQFSWRLNLLGR